MNTKLTARSICAIALGGWATIASALSIGPVTGAAVMGRPLALAAPIQFDELARGNGSGCVTVEVRYGDRIVDGARVDVDDDGDATRQLSVARISSAVPIDEPFVTVVLNAGCGRLSSRRYVLLAEAPRSEPMALASASALAVATAGAPVAAAPVAGTRSRAERSRTARRGAAVQREAAQRSGGRLQLAVWDPASEQQPWLRASTQLTSSPAVDAERRAAAITLWQALNAQPQDLLRTAERLSGLEGDVRSLRSLSARHRAEIESTRESLQGAQGRLHANLLLVTLLALLAGSAGAVLWHRVRRSSASAAADSWYAGLEPWEDADVDPDSRAPDPVAASTPQAGDRAVSRLAPVGMARDAGPALALPSASLVQESDRSGHKVDALQAAQQQAEFFASLGQIDEAVAVLTSYLEESRERPVLAFLELFRIYHGTSMREQYEELQSTFRRTFGMDVASFGEYSDEPRELDLYLMPVTRIASAWPSEQGQDIIEELLFKRPASPRDLLSLQAYRDLVWLYALGQEIVHNTGSPAGLQLLGDRGLSNDHFILPWAVGEPEQPTELSLARLDTIEVAPELTAFGVDIDLTAARGDAHPATGVQLAQPGPTPAPDIEPGTHLDAFDAAMEPESHRHR